MDSSLPSSSSIQDETMMKSWRDLFNKEEQSLRFSPPSLMNGKSLVTPPKDLFERGAEKWKDSVVAQFIGKPLNFCQFQKTAKILWGSDIDVKAAKSNLYIIHFSNPEARVKVLEGGPWHIQNQPLVEGLGFIASAIGNPLYMDCITATHERLAYARVCIEVEVMKEIPDTIDVLMDNGNIITVTVQVPWIPRRCSHSKLFGHSNDACLSKPSIKIAQVWRPKKNVKEVPNLTAMISSSAKASVTAKSGSLNRFDTLSKVVVDDEVCTSTRIDDNVFKTKSDNVVDITYVDQGNTSQIVHSCASDLKGKAVMTNLNDSGIPRDSSNGLDALLKSLHPVKKAPSSKGTSKRGSKGKKGSNSKSQTPSTS
ncbi:hypothetical protein PTKIN_Ptkin02bG0116000 [Pterospermum kingtungense]